MQEAPFASLAVSSGWGHGPSPGPLRHGGLGRATRRDRALRSWREEAAGPRHCCPDGAKFAERAHTLQCCSFITQR